MFRIKKAHLLGLVFTCFAPAANAQSIRYFPEAFTYLSANVTSDTGGLTFLYRYQLPSLAHKAILIRTTADGEELWTKSVTGLGNYIITSDNAVLMSGSIPDGPGSRKAVIRKTDAGGIQIWSKGLKSSSGDLYVTDVIEGQGMTYVTLGRGLFSSNTYYNRAAVMGVGANGATLWTKFYGQATFTVDYGFRRAMTAANGDFIGLADVRGSFGSSANGMMLTRIAPDGTIVFSRYIDFLSTHTQLSVNGLAETADGDIVVGGRLMTDQISMGTNTMWMGRFDGTGTLQLQKTYSGGENAGEMLHSLMFANGKLYAYIQTVGGAVNRALMVAEVDPATLSIGAATTLDISVATEDPYGDVSNSFCISTNGEPVVAGGFHCAELGKTIPLMVRLSPDLSSGCSALEIVFPLTDTLAAYPVSAYAPAGTFSIVESSATFGITDTTSLQSGDLCNGCVMNTSIEVPGQPEELQLFPNPNDGNFTVSNVPEGAEMIVINSMGQVMGRQKVSGNEYRAKLEGLPSGIYLVSVSGHSKVMKMIIE